MQELRNMVSQLTHRLESFEDNRASLSRTEGDHMERNLLLRDSRSKITEGNDNRSKTAEGRSLSPVLIRNKGRNRRLSPMTRNYKKTLHVCYIFIIKIYLLFNL